MKVIKCILCAENKPPKSKMFQCMHCNKWVWVTEKHLEKKDEGEGRLIWCTQCCEKYECELEEFGEPNKGDNNKDNDSSSWTDQIDFEGLFGRKDTEDKFDYSGWEEELPPEIKEWEQKAFLRSISGTEQKKANLERILPSLCFLFMTRIKPFDRTDDVILADVLYVFTSEILHSRRETLGLGHMFDGWERHEVIHILAFMYGVGKAMEKAVDEDTFNLDEVSQHWKQNLLEWLENMGVENPDE